MTQAVSSVTGNAWTDSILWWWWIHSYWIHVKQKGEGVCDRKDMLGSGLRCAYLKDVHALLLRGKHMMQNHQSNRISFVLYMYRKICTEIHLYWLIPKCQQWWSWRDEIMDDFHCSLCPYAVSAWSEYYFYNHGNSSNKATSISKQSRGNIFYRSFPVTLVASQLQAIESFICS